MSSPRGTSRQYFGAGGFFVENVAGRSQVGPAQSANNGLRFRELLPSTTLLRSPPVRPLDLPHVALTSLGDALELLIARSEKSGQVLFEDGRIEETAHGSERRAVLDLIEHPRPDLVLLERVAVTP